METRKLTTALMVCLLVLPGCDRGAKQEEVPDSKTRADESLTAQVERHYARAKATVAALTPSRTDVEKRTSEEAIKLQALEYKVAEYALSLPAEDLQIELNTLGRDRWDCAEPIIVNAEQLRFICKRRSKSYLRFLPQVLGLGLSDIAVGE